MSPGQWVVPLCFAALLLVASAHAEGKAADNTEANAEQAVDAEFLEYLGSVESQAENWTDFESSEDVQTAKATQGDSDQSSRQNPPARKPTQVSSPLSNQSSTPISESGDKAGAQ